MKFKIGDIYYGFKLEDERKIDEVKSIGRVFTHVKSGARLISLENDDDNKVFSISFKTLPQNNKGIPHILEHSVLCGSKKFPVKEPFVEILKGSLNTYLNAATYPDKTMYPVASRNYKDFKNLMNVYLDAVFYPAIYKTPEIFMQEGWHYDIDERNGKPDYNGIVYNEMKGTYSSPVAILLRGVDELLFKDNIYRYDSGGKPEEIVKLSRDEFIKFHEEYYNPSNSIIYLYGDVKIDEELKFINDEYLSKFEKKEIKNIIIPQQAFQRMEEKELEYSISKDESENDKTYFSLSFCTGSVLDEEMYFALDILESILLGLSSSPLKRAIIEANIGKDVFGVFDNSIMQTTFSIILKDSNLSEKNKFKDIVFKVLEELCENGIDRKVIEAVINAREFEIKEADYESYPRGLEYNEKILDRMLYGGEPFENLKFEEKLKKIKAAVKDNYFEKIIKKYFLNNKHSVLVTVKPKKNLEYETNKIVLEELKNKIMKCNMKEILEQNKKLKLRYETPDKKEDLSKIPMLSIKDINPKSDYFESEKINQNGIDILYTPLNTNGINYMNLYFDSSVVPPCMIPYLSLFSILIGRINTEKYNFKDLSNEVNMNIGGMDFSLEPYSNIKEIDKYIPEFVVRTKVLKEKTSKLFEFLEEILNKTIYDDYVRIKELIEELKSRLEMSMQSRAHRVATVRLGSYYSQMYKYIDLISGIEFYKFLCKLQKSFDEEKEGLSEKLKECAKLVFNSNNLLVGYSGDRASLNEFLKLFSEFTGKLRKDSVSKYNYEFKLEKLNEGLIISSKVQCVAKGYNFKKLNFENNGILSVVKAIANYDYLWGKVRVQGGAYGAFASFSGSGNMNLCSYRDPGLSETFDVYDNFANYIENFDADYREITKYILGTISTIDMPLSSASKCERTVLHYITNIDMNYVQRIRDEILKADIHSIRKSSQLIEECMKENYICVIGNEHKINENADKFKSIINVFAEN